MNTSISFHNVVSIEVSGKQDHNSFTSRTITIKDKDGRETEINLYARLDDGEPTDALDLRL